MKKKSTVQGQANPSIHALVIQVVLRVNIQTKRSVSGRWFPFAIKLKKKLINFRMLKTFTLI